MDGLPRHQKTPVDPKKPGWVEQFGQFVEAVLHVLAGALPGREPGGFVVEEKAGYVGSLEAAQLRPAAHQEALRAARGVGQWG